MNNFKQIDGVIVNVIDHILQTINNNSIKSIHIGTDSQNIGRNTVFVTVVAFRYGITQSKYDLNSIGKGVHYIFKKEKIKKIKDIHARLFMEAERSIELASWIQEQLPTIKLELDFDYNSDENHVSNKLVAQTKGWAEALGFAVNIKPNKQIATRAADHLCR